MATKLSDRERTRLDSALVAICDQAGLEPAGAVLLRYTMNAVYRLDRAGVVVRMTTGPKADSQTSRVVQVAATFADHHLPTVRLAPGIHQPVHAGPWSATLWALLPQPPGHRFAPLDLAGPLRAIHSSSARPVDLPTWDPVGKSQSRLAEVEGLQGAGLKYLQDWGVRLVGMKLDKITDRLGQRCEQLASALCTVRWALPWSVIHGDAHAGNLLRDVDGRVVICDLDSVAFGPAEWDLTPAAHGALRFGDDPRQHEALAEAYGLDVTSSPAWEALRQARELQLLLSVMASLPGRPAVADELAHRLRTSLSGDCSARWCRYR